jgi:hypothetical protein
MSGSEENLADAWAEALGVSVEGGRVLVRGSGLPALALSPEAAVVSADRLLEAADQARRIAAGAQAPKPPFPPANLVSPHGAG